MKPSKPVALSVSMFAAVVATAITGSALTIGISKNAGELDSGAVMFFGLVVVLGVLPYVVTARLSRANRPFLNTWALFAAISYGFVDLVVRTQAAFFPTSSTDAVALLTMPIIGAPIVFAASALASRAWIAFARSRDD